MSEDYADEIDEFHQALYQYDKGARIEAVENLSLGREANQEQIGKTIDMLMIALQYVYFDSTKDMTVNETAKEVLSRLCAGISGTFDEQFVLEKLLDYIGINTEIDDYVRSSVITSIAELGECALDPLINILLDDKNGHNVRAAAAIGLGKIGVYDQCADQLVSVLKEKTPSIRVAAAIALKKLGEPKWRGLVKGEEEDFKRLLDSGDTRVILDP